VLWEAGERLWVDLSGLVRNRLGRRLARAALPYVAPGASLALQKLIDEGRFPPPGPLHARPIGRVRTAWRILRVLIPMIVRALRTALRPDVERERLFRLLEGMLADFEAHLAQATDPGERLALIRRMADRAFTFVIPQFVPRFGLSMAAYNLLVHLAATVPQEAIDVRVMMRGVPHNVTTEMDLALWETSQAIRADPESLAHFSAHEVAALADDYLQDSLPPAAQGAIEDFMAHYGMRGLAEIDLGRPRWREEPQPILQTLRSYLGISEDGQAPDAVYERGRQAAEAEVRRLVQAVRITRGGWIKARFARAAAARMRALIGLREAPKFAVVRLLSRMRRALLDDGARWAAEGLLDQAEDVFALHMRELETLAAGQMLATGGKENWAALAQDRRQRLAQEQRRRQIPRLLLSDGEAFYEGVTPSQAMEDTILQGDPVSPGVVEGSVRVVLDPRSAQLGPGEILVCLGTDPSWTPLFLTAGGLVMEVGGMMTHGAVVAREYGLPAVVGVHEATQRLRTGQRVRVDGSSGQVALLDKSPQAGG
jgi:pyruvate,water dikinase